mgnify:CR=1 FL=1
MQQEEEFWQERRRMLQEEEEEEREINEYERRLEFMFENCTVYDRHICGLIEEQRELLNALRMGKTESAM